MLPKIEFECGQPLVLHLRYPQGKEVVSRYYERFYGDTIQYVFSAEEGVFYLSDSAGGLLNARLRSHGVVPGQAVTITKMRVPNPNTDRPVTEYFCKPYQTPPCDGVRRLTRVKSAQPDPAEPDLDEITTEYFTSTGL